MSEAKLSPREYGRIGARKRWGDPGVVRLDELTPEQRRLVRALVDAARGNEKAVEDVQRPSTAQEENDGGSRRLPSAE
jgi:hypothetical protein